MRDSLHGDKLKRRQKELRSWAEGAASLHVLNQLGTTVDEFLQVHLVQASIVFYTVHMLTLKLMEGFHA